MPAYIICKQQQVGLLFYISPIIIIIRDNNSIFSTLETPFSGFFYYIAINKANYRSSTFTGVKSDTSANWPFSFVIINKGRRSSTFTGVKFLGFAAPLFLSLNGIILAGTEFTSTGVAGISYLPAIINTADTESISTGVADGSYPPAIINKGRRSSTFTGVKFLGFAAPLSLSLNGIILAGTEFTSTGVAGISYLPIETISAGVLSETGALRNI
ncbi:MAG: hypothetical protein A2252_11010 [Elusimicrobia bacterium RIFOXYA2_FULL_39_19]|nr:MAG: hypothetical protein A2252_11010 [Elusimicrobia bacterium RIFOXYA2_FULL_39_19]